jgi:RNA polymerase sigma-70 factor (ECF subfamily)
MSGRLHPVLDSALIADDDAPLIFAIQSRDRAALERLYLGYHPRLARFLARMIARSEDIEEIINDTFMVVWTHATAFRSESLVSTWIFGIAYRMTLRSLGRQKMQLLEWSAGILPEQCADPTPDTEMTNWLECALGRLPVKLRITVTLAYQMGFSVEEISEANGLRSGRRSRRYSTVAQRINSTADEETTTRVVCDARDR